jgi:hypothetical protein
MTPSAWLSARLGSAAAARIKSEARGTTTDFFMVVSF